MNGGINKLNDSSEPVRRRNRKVINCSFCRQRKLRCDRQNPCGNCLKKNNGKCKYSNEWDATTNFNSNAIGASGFRTMDSFASTRLPVNEMKQRLDKMESLVLSLMNDKRTGPSAGISSVDQPYLDLVGPPTSAANLAVGGTDMLPSEATEVTFAKGPGTYPKKEKEEEDVDQLGDSLGMLKLDTKGKSMYHGDTYYGYLFSEISGVQQLLNQFRDQVVAIHGLRTGFGETFTSNSGQSAEMHGDRPTKVTPEQAKTAETLCSVELSGVPFGAIHHKLMSQDVLKRIPSRDICNILVDRFFSVIEPVIHIVHRNTFDIGFSQFWACPEKTDVLWVAFFFGVITVGLQSFSPKEIPEFFGGYNEASEWWSEWISSMELCGFAGKLTFKPSLLNIRVLLLWQIIESYKSDWIHRSWTSMGVLVRVAQSMGLHRDPSWFVLSTYEREERRRLWASIKYIDVMHSISQGLPLGIRECENDVKEPLNLDDGDVMPLKEEGTETALQGLDLETMRTDSSFSIIRNRISDLRAEIYVKNQNIGLKDKLTNAMVWEYDTKLRTLYNSVPVYLRGRPILGLDVPEIIIQKLFLELEFLRTIVVLHRRHALAAVKNQKLKRSRDEVMNACVTVIELMHWFYCTNSYGDNYDPTAAAGGPTTTSATSGSTTSDSSTGNSGDSTTSSNANSVPNTSSSSFPTIPMNTPNDGFNVFTSPQGGSFSFAASPSSLLDNTMQEVRLRFWNMFGAFNTSIFMHAVTFVGVTLMNAYDLLSGADRTRYLNAMSRVSDITKVPALINMDPRHVTIVELLLKRVDEILSLRPEERQREVSKVRKQSPGKSARMMEMVPDDDNCCVDDLNYGNSPSTGRSHMSDSSPTSVDAAEPVIDMQTGLDDVGAEFGITNDDFWNSIPQDWPQLYGMK